MQFTDQQQQAIDARGRSVIVSAAAGSGKTAVLVERLIKIISDSENRVPVERIVVVTFTKAAAAEMKQRLLVRLTEEADRSDSRWVARQCSLLDTASISTIDSFSIGLIREHIAALDLGADFRIADESEIKVFSDAVMEQLMEELYVTRPDDMELLRGCFCGSNDKKLELLISELHHRISTIPFFEKKLRELPDKYKIEMYSEFYMERLEQLLLSHRTAAERCLKLASAVSDIRLIDVIESDRRLLCDLLDILKRGELSEAVEAAVTAKFEAFPRDRKAVPDPMVRNTVKEIRAGYYDAGRIRGAGDFGIFAYAEDDLNRHREIVRILSEMIIKYDKMLLDYKFAKNAIGFADEERLALSLLGEIGEDGTIRKTALGEEISGYYDVIMVDEFQDTNDRQDMIFRLLSRNGDANHYGDNLFFVGDVKQAIYRFRLANPDNFIKAQNEAVPYSEGGSGMASITLNRNFRSSPEVIDFVNFIFENIMSDKCGDINYDREHMLVNGLGFCPGERKTVVNLIDKKADGEEAEALNIAYTIRKMLDDGVPVSLDGGKSSRPCRMSDFCILMRSMVRNEIYERALKSYGIPASCPDPSGYLKSSEISVLIDLLRIVDNPLLDVPAAAVMMSPMFMFTPDDMINIRLINKKKNIYSNICTLLEIKKYSEGGYSDIAEKIEKGEGDGDSLDYYKTLFHRIDTEYKELLENAEGRYKGLFAKAERFSEFLADLRLRATFSALPELIQYIYDKTDFIYVIQLHKNAARKKSNLRLLLEYANSFESNSGTGVRGFVKYIDRVMETGGDFEGGAAAGAGRNAVSIMTMHKSKGLEFPFVFLAETDRSFNKIDLNKNFQFSDRHGIGFRLQNKELYEKFITVPFDVIRAENELKMKSEEMRLLYVAMTRARERLFLTLDISESRAKDAESFSASIEANKGITPGLAASADSMGDWIAMALILSPDGEPFAERLGIIQNYCAEGKLPVVFEKPDIRATSQGVAEDLSKNVTSADTGLIRKLEEQFSFQYDKWLVDKVSKFSVSDVSKHDEMGQTVLARPGFACEGGITPTERGTAVHCFLQFADFPRLREENGFEEEKERMIRRGHITPRQGAVVTREDIHGFVNSPVYDEIMDSVGVVREMKFMVSLEELDMKDKIDIDYEGTDGMLTGIMDMVIEKEDSLILVDYKTDKVKDGGELIRRYGKQLLLYKNSLELMQEKPVTKTYIYSVYQKKALLIP